MLMIRLVTFPRTGVNTGEDARHRRLNPFCCLRVLHPLSLAGDFPALRKRVTMPDHLKDDSARLNAETQTSNSPLQGVRVLELGSFVAGPTATRILADFGADVMSQGHHRRPPQFRAGGRVTGLLYTIHLILRTSHDDTLKDRETSEVGVWRICVVPVKPLE